MKKHLLLVAMLSISVVSFARSPFNVNQSKKQRPDYEIMQGILQKQFARTNTAAKQTGTLQKRLIANSYTNVGMLQDSNHYYYSFGRGSVLSGPESYADNYYPTSYSDVRSLLCDKSINWHDFGGSAGLEQLRVMDYVHNSDNKVMDMTYTTDWLQMEYKISYNSQNLRETLITVDSFNGTPFEPKSTRYFSYNSQGKLIKDSTIDIATSATTGRNEYTYDAAGNLTLTNSYYFDNALGKMLNFYRGINTYDNQNRLTSSTTQYDFGGAGLFNNAFDTMTYTGNSTKYNHFENYFWDGQANKWQIFEWYDYHYNPQQLLDTYYIYNYNGLVADTIERDVYTYNSENLITVLHGYYYQGNNVYGPNPYDTTKMYYEEYDPTVINAVTHLNQNIVLYPNPSAGILIISGGNNKADLDVINELGQVIMQEKNVHLQHSSLDIGRIPAGNYILNIREEDGFISQKQFTKI